MTRTFTLMLCALLLQSCVGRQQYRGVDSCAVELVVLGTGQDAGAPQIGNPIDPAWADPSLRLTPTSLALVDYRSKSRFLFDATPQITAQLQTLDSLLVPGSGLGIDGIFITHAHIGHYAGLMFLGREAAGSADVPVFTMPRMSGFLKNNGPWSQLIGLGNIDLITLTADQKFSITNDVNVVPLPVPHRDEYSETVGFLIETNDRSALYLPDIDSWQEWSATYGVELEEVIEDVDVAFIDATFFDDNELPGRDMAQIPHPRVVDTMNRLHDRPPDFRQRVRFIHYNHTNPIRFPESEQSQLVRAKGFGIAREGQTFCLVD